MNIYTLIKSALEYYDKIYNDYKHNFKSSTISFSTNESTTDADKIIVYDQNKKVIAHFKHEVLGMYIAEYSMWIWSWAIPYLPAKTTKVARKILDYGITNDLPIQIKVALTNSRIIMPDTSSLDIQIALAIYLSKQTGIYNYTIELDKERTVTWVLAITQ